MRIWLEVFSLTPRSGKSYHPVSPSRFTYKELFESLPAFGYSVQLVPYVEWRSALIAACNDSAKANVLSAVLSQFSEDW